jgi:hypothetical protein
VECRRSFSAARAVGVQIESGAEGVELLPERLRLGFIPAAVGVGDLLFQPCDLLRSRILLLEAVLALARFHHRVDHVLGATRIGRVGLRFGRSGFRPESLDIGHLLRERFFLYPHGLDELHDLVLGDRVGAGRSRGARW